MDVLLSQFPGVIFAGGGVVTSTTPGVQKISAAWSDRIEMQVSDATKKATLAIMIYPVTKKEDE